LPNNSPPVLAREGGVMVGDPSSCVGGELFVGHTSITAARRPMVALVRTGFFHAHSEKIIPPTAINHAIPKKSGVYCAERWA
jgi:hypothetical protein